MSAKDMPETAHEKSLSPSVGSASLRTADVSPRSSPLRDVSQGGTSAIQRQKFHTDDLNQCLHNKSGSHEVAKMQICSILRFSWSNLVKCCVELRMSSSKTQIHRVYI